MKTLFTLFFAGIISISLMGQQEIKELEGIKEFKDRKDQRYLKEHQTGNTAFEREKSRNVELSSRHYSGHPVIRDGNLLKAGNATRQKLDSLHWELYDALSSDWALSDRELFSYDSKGNMTTYLWYAYDSTAMKILPYDKEIVTFNDQGDLIEVIWQIWDNGANQWVNWGKYEYIYDDKGNLIRESISDWGFIENQWSEGARFDKTYDVDGNMLTELWIFWNEDSLKLVPTFKDEYLYEDGKLTSLEEYLWQEGEWALFIRTTYLYNPSGNLSEELTQIWNSVSEVWWDVGKSLYTYNENEKLIAEEVWEIESTQLILIRTWLYEYAWDSDGNNTSQIDKSWDEGSSTWQNSSKSEWTFNKNFNISDISAPYWIFQEESTASFTHMPVSEQGSVWMNGDWAPDYRQTAYYSDLGTTGIEAMTETNLRIFPVPASSSLTFSWEDSHNTLNLELYDLTGKRVIWRTIANNETVKVDHLSGGVYLYKLTDNEYLIHSGKISIR